MTEIQLGSNKSIKLKYSKVFMTAAHMRSKHTGSKKKKKKKIYSRDTDIVKLFCLHRKLRS